MKNSLFAILFLGFCSFSYAQMPMSYLNFSESFQCPESLATEAEQQSSLERFMQWATVKYPNLTVEKLVNLRTKLLKEHRCDKTLANIQEPSKGAHFKESKTRYQCIGESNRLYFSKFENKKCKTVPLEKGWENFLIEKGFIVDINFSKILKENNGVKVWARYYLAEPSTFSFPKTSSTSNFDYNYIQSVTKYFCQTKQQLLIQGTYILNGVVQYERLSNESVMEEIEPGTISELLVTHLCK